MYPTPSGQYSFGLDGGGFEARYLGQSSDLLVAHRYAAAASYEELASGLCV